jgi:antitoxin (DNA-binding transcriptional repressor) of toxin-antitoxin stability system
LVPSIEKVLRVDNCDAKMHHMRKATVRDLRYRFREVENLLREGEEVQITKRKRVIATLMPAQPNIPSPRPDFLARLKKLHRSKPLKVSGAELVSRERDRN